MRYLGSLSPSSLSRRKSTTWRVPFLGFATFSSVFPRDENLSASFSGERAIRWQPRTSLNPNLLCQKLERSREREREKGRKQRLCWRSLPTEKEAGEGPGHSANFLSVELLFFSFLFLLLLFAFSPTHRRDDRPDFNFRSLWRGERPPRTTRLFRNTWKLSIGNNAGILYWQERAPATTRTTTFVERTSGKCTNYASNCTIFSLQRWNAYESLGNYRYESRTIWNERNAAFRFHDNRLTTNDISTSTSYTFFSFCNALQNS